MATVEWWCTCAETGLEFDPETLPGVPVLECSACGDIVRSVPESPEVIWWDQEQRKLSQQASCYDQDDEDDGDWP